MTVAVHDADELSLAAGLESPLGPGARDGRAIVLERASPGGPFELVIEFPGEDAVLARAELRGDWSWRVLRASYQRGEPRDYRSTAALGDHLAGAAPILVFADAWLAVHDVSPVGAQPAPPPPPRAPRPSSSALSIAVTCLALSLASFLGVLASLSYLRDVHAVIGALSCGVAWLAFLAVGGFAFMASNDAPPAPPRHQRWLVLQGTRRTCVLRAVTRRRSVDIEHDAGPELTSVGFDVEVGGDRLSGRVWVPTNEAMSVAEGMTVDAIHHPTKAQAVLVIRGALAWCE